MMKKKLKEKLALLKAGEYVLNDRLFEQEATILQLKKENKEIMQALKEIKERIEGHQYEQ